VRVILQRVSSAAVTVEGRTVGRIGPGVCLLVGFTHTDSSAEVTWMASRVATLRIFGDAEGKMNLGLRDVGGAALVVSQFTVYGDASRGRRPSFIDAARPEVALPLYEQFIAELQALGLSVESGEFGAMMEVSLVNDGPVTILLERP